MLIKYQGRWSRENIEGLVYQKLADSYVKKAGRELWLEVDKETFYLLMSSPRNAARSGRYREKWKLSFREEGIHLGKCFTVDSFLLTAGVLVLLFTALGMLMLALGNAADWGGFVCCFVLAALGVWCIILQPAKAVLGYFSEMMEEK